MCTDELSSEIKALLAVDVVQIQWAQPEHSELILSKLAESDARYAKKARRRRDQQDFEFMTSYFTSEMWDTMLNAEVSADAKLLCIITHTIRMGLRLPTEPTHKLMCSLWTLISESTSTINRMDVVTKALRLRRHKVEFNKLRDKVGDPIMWVQVLPSNPCDFTANFKPLYDLAFGTSPPVASRIQPDVIRSFDMTYGCRGGLKRGCLNLSIASTASSSGLELVVCAKPFASVDAVPASMDPGAGFQQFAVGFMQQMYTSQQKMIEVMMSRGTGSNDSFGSARTVSLAALQDRLKIAAPAPAVALPALPWPNQPAFVEEVESPAPKTCRAESEDGDDLGDLFEMMQLRKEAAKIEAKAKAIAKLAAAQADGPGKPNATPTPVKEKAPAKAVAAPPPANEKAPAKEVAAPPPAKEKVPAKAVAAPPLAKGKAPAKAVGAPPPAKEKAPAPAVAAPPPSKGKAPAKGKALAKAAAPIKAAAADAGAPLVLGCSKCRWGCIGCGQCRDPAFSGARWNVTVGAKAKAPKR